MIFVMLTAACGSDEPDRPEAGTANGGESQAEAPGAELVGTWERVTTCAEVVRLFEEEGLKKWIPEMVAGNSFVPGVRKVADFKDPSRPCMGSVPRVHSHFFTEDGEFGSLDWRGNQVDDGTYEIADGETFNVSKEFPEPSRSATS